MSSENNDDNYQMDYDINDQYEEDQTSNQEEQEDYEMEIENINYSENNYDFLETNEESKETEGTTHTQNDNNTRKYEIWAPYRIQDEIVFIRNQLMSEYGLNEGQAILTLKEGNWDIKKSQRLLQNDVFFYQLLQNEQEQIKPNTELLLCPCCFDEYVLKDCYGLSCGHYFCKQCFKDYIIVALEEGPCCVLKECPFTGCKQIIIEDCFIKLTESHQFTRYLQFLTETVVSTSKQLKWCPNAGCDKAFKFFEDIDKMKKVNAICDCGQTLCTSCCHETHRPLNCEINTKWTNLVEGKENDPNYKWMRLFAKACPKCSVSIEKNEGCMRMTCRNCLYEFCWLCMNKWSVHGYNMDACNVYKVSPVETDDPEKQKEKQELERYGFYSDRYLLHKNSVNFALKKREKMLNEFDQYNLQVLNPEIKNDFIKNALDTIIESRRAVAHTYGLGYFIKDQNTKKFFEFQQSELEHTLEILDYKTNISFNDFLEILNFGEKNSISYSSSFYKFKLDVINLTAVLKKYFNQVLESFEKENFLANGTTSHQDTLPQLKKTSSTKSQSKNKKHSNR